MIKRFICRIFLVVVILCPVSEVIAGDISYDYAQADYISDTVDLTGSIDDVEGNGIGFSISLSVAPAFAAKLAVASTTFEVFQGKAVVTTKVTTLGVTAHTSVVTDVDVFTNVSVIKAEITADDGVNLISENDYSAIVDAGVRYRATDKLELEARLSHVNVFGYTINTSTVTGRFYFRKRLSVGASYVANSDKDSLLISARMDI